MRRIDKLSKDEIVDLMIDVSSVEVCTDCPICKNHNPLCNHEDNDCIQSLVYYLTEE